MRRLLIFIIVLYRATLGHFMSGQCQYHPTCSQYAIDAITKYGPIIGSWKSLKRISRCHPWSRGGFDPA
jgi:putative membrane protein insertion efficiency factor